MLSAILADAFRRSKYSNVKEWQTETKCKLSAETVSRTILRGVEPSIPTFIIMAYHLGVQPREIAQACRDAGDNVFYSLISPSDIDPEDRQILELLRKIDHDKKVLAINLLKSMGA